MIGVVDEVVASAFRGGLLEPYSIAGPYRSNSETDVPHPISQWWRPILRWWRGIRTSLAEQCQKYGLPMFMSHAS